MTPPSRSFVVVVVRGSRFDRPGSCWRQVEFLIDSEAINFFATSSENLQESFSSILNLTLFPDSGCHAIKKIFNLVSSLVDERD
jgi:hypothetical protein